MRLLRLHVQNFGVLQDFRMDFTKGLNCIHRENGWGKSTLATFIKAMFYGLPVTSKRSLEENERKKYTPWQGGAYGGNLEFETAKGRFRVERFFGAKESGDSFALYDLASNKPTSVYPTELGEALFGIDADGFERTVYLSQRQIAPKGENNSIAAKLGDLLDDVDDIGGFDDAMAALEKRRKFYVLTGNRGRIADLEQERSERRAEREQILRKAEMLATLETSLAEKKKEAQALGASLATLRKQIQRAGLVREARVLQAQSERMREELDALERRRHAVDQALGGEHPTREELEAQRTLSERGRDARARLDALPTVTTAPERLELLPFGASSRLPEEGMIAKLRVENTRLQNLSHREESLRALLREDAGGRFAEGLPTGAQMDAAFASLQKADDLKKEIAELGRASEKKKSYLGLPCVLCMAMGLLLLVASFLPPLSGMLALSIAGGALLSLGALCGLFWLRAVGAARAEREARLALCKEKEAERDALLRALKQRLSAYGFSTREEDLTRSLTELSVLAEQARERIQRAKGAKEELASLEGEKMVSLGFLQTSFRSLGISLPAKNDYRDEIESLQRDTERILRARREAQTRDEKRAAAEAEWNNLKQQMLPFLRRFDRERKMTAMECLQRVSEWEAEYRSLSVQIDAKKEALRRFLSEHGEALRNATQDAVEERALEERENALQSRLHGLQRECAALQTQIERMEQDTERLSEIEAQLLQLEEEIAVAKANSATIAHTAKLLEEAKTALSTRYLADMQTSFQRFFAVLNADEAVESVMDASFEVSLREGGKTHSLESFSRGRRDAVQLCVRLSLTDALYKEEEKPFLILDDPFVNLDDVRLPAARRLIEDLSASYQILYMVCHADRL